MATSNLTGDGQQETVEKILCSAGLTAGLHSHLTFLSILNSFLSMTFPTSRGSFPSVRLREKRDLCHGSKMALI